MWEFWLEKRGRPSEALMDFPEVLKKDGNLQMALATIKSNEDHINRIMLEKQAEGKLRNG
jgi:hypothetical protein